MDALAEPLLASKEDDHEQERAPTGKCGEVEVAVNSGADPVGAITSLDEESAEVAQSNRGEEGNNEHGSFPTMTEESTNPALPTRLVHIGRKFLLTPLMPKGPSNLKMQLRFLRFLGVTLLGIVATHFFVFTLNWEHRKGLTLYDTWVYEGNLILLDCIAMFSVGRLFDRSAVDHLAWMSVMLLSSLYTSTLPHVSWLRHSVTLYELHCTWPWQLWIFVVALCVPVCAGVVILHLRHAQLQEDLTRKTFEVMLTMILFLVPQMLHTNFEFHHWFAGLLCGMHANYDVWWSQLAMAWCWGQYVNGIAVWGRDPPLKCSYASYITKRQGCCRHHRPLEDTVFGVADGHRWGGVSEEACWLDDSAIHNSPAATLFDDITSLTSSDWRHCDAHPN
ncbi:expressed unknown protein [Seminavis robusta]|uniref:Uncharacterized protein n=1 Tax=Seminavis robusta TaxID=568900 RepID=A0A9N8E902_9STRA|nr:expressed unknown protein [Seminavis robusta]|eukprot:Sro788_g202560.1 n/a (391) ;mRNA; r:31446-32712